MYDPGLGAFISVDPVMDLADPQQWNAYAYANNNPTTYSDPTGMLFEECHNGTYSCTVNSSGNIKAKKKPPVVCDAPAYVPPTVWETYSAATVEVAQDYGHDAVDVVGLIPGAGIPADVANASWYYTEGDNLNGALSAIGVVPILGEIVVAGKRAFKGGKWAWEAVEAANSAGAATKAAPSGPTFVANTDGVVISTSRSRLVEGFESAGFSSVPTRSSGKQFTLPDGTLARVMDPSGQAPSRVSFTNTNGGPINPFTGKPVQPAAGLTKPQRLEYIRARTHLELGQ
jgi:hypothetical protein